MSASRFLALVLGAMLLGGCTMGSTVLTGSGRTVDKSYDFSGFTKVNVGNAFTVDIEQTDGYEVTLTVDDNLVDYLDVSREGDTLRIYLKPRLSLGLRNVTLRARVGLPELTGLELSGATRGTVRGFRSDERLDLEVSGASRLTGSLEAGDTRMEVSGASTVELEGKAADLRVNVSGASTVRLDSFPSEDTTVNASGASRASVSVSGRLAAEASGASSVRYAGNPTSVDSQTSGASSVERR